MFLNQQVEAMVIPTIVALIVGIKLLATSMVNHTLKASPLNNSLPYQCIMVAHLPLAATGELDLNSHTRLDLLALNHMPVLLHNQCKA
jgi:hypothetical protein